MTKIKYDDLKQRVQQFNALELPGQPRMMHMGTSYLIHDLWIELEKSQKVLKEADFLYSNYYLLVNRREDDHDPGRWIGEVRALIPEPLP